MEEPKPPAEIYCPKCRDGGGVAPWCYRVAVTATGVQLHAYHCPGCDQWLIARWTKDRPAAYLVSDILPEKPNLAMLRARR